MYLSKMLIYYRLNILHLDKKRLPKKAKNTIKTRLSSGLFSSFFGAVSWLASLSFRGLVEPDGRSSHRWDSVNGGGGRCRLIRMILIERTDEFLKMLDCQ